MPTYVNSLNNAILRANIDPKIMGNPSAYGKFLILYLCKLQVNRRAYKVN